MSGSIKHHRFLLYGSFELFSGFDEFINCNSDQ